MTANGPQTFLASTRAIFLMTNVEQKFADIHQNDCFDDETRAVAVRDVGRPMTRVKQNILVYTFSYNYLFGFLKFYVLPLLLSQTIFFKNLDRHRSSNVYFCPRWHGSNESIPAVRIYIINEFKFE